jgi:hypothetical protein
MTFKAFTAARLRSRSAQTLTTTPPWFRVPVFGMLITLIGKGNSVRPADLDSRPNPKLRPQL